MESVSLRPAIHKPFAAPAIPPNSTFRVASSMMNRTVNRCNPRLVHTSTVKK
jgi:hypothetical protein